MSKFYNNPDDQEENDIYENDKINEDDGYEQYVPFYDEQDGEYKYVPAGSGDISDEEEVIYNKQKSTANYDGYNAKQILDKIEHLNCEINKSNKKTDEDKINKLSAEVETLKEQLFRIKTLNEIKSEFESFKKEFIQNHRSNYKDDDGFYYYGGHSPMQKRDNSQVRRKEPISYGYIGKSDKNEDDIEKIASKIKEEIYREKELDNAKILKEIEKLSQKNLSESDIMEKVNSVIDRKLNESCDIIISKITAKLEQRLNDIKTHNEHVILNALNKENSEDRFLDLKEQIEQLKDSTDLTLGEYSEKQNGLMVKFAEIAEKLEQQNVIDKENLYAETMLDGIGDIKTELAKSVKEITELKENNKIIKENLTSQGREIDSLRDNIAQIFSESSDYQLKLINSNIMNLEEAVKTYSDNAAKTVDEIKQEIAYEVEGKAKKEDIENLKEEMLQQISSIKPEVVLLSGKFESLQNDFTVQFENAITELKENSKNEENLASIIDQLKQDLSQKLEDALIELKDNAQTDEKLVNALEENKTEILQKSQQQLEDINTVLTEKHEETTKSLSEITGLRDELATMITELKEKVYSRLVLQSEDLNKNLQSQQEQMLLIIQKEISNIGDSVNAETRDLLEKQEDIIKDFIKESQGNMAAVEGLSISVDTLLRQAEENVTVQSDIKINIESINAQISSITAQTEELIEKYQKTAEELKSELAENLSQKLDGIAKIIGGEDAQKGLSTAIKALEEKIESLKKTVMMMRGGKDSGYELSAIFSEIRKLGEKVKIDSAVDTNALYQSKKLSQLKNELDEISDISEKKHQ